MDRIATIDAVGMVLPLPHQRIFKDTAFTLVVRIALASDTDICVEHTCPADRDGYGQVKFKGKMYKAHRVAFAAANGTLDESLLVCHSCDNTKCINPKHLFQGTVKDNTQDMISKGRDRDRRVLNAVKGEKHSSAKLTESIVLAVRADKRSAAKIAAELGVSSSCIEHIKARHTWKHI